MDLAWSATVRVSAPGCGALNRRGLGVLVAPDLVLTDAHVVAGAKPLSVAIRLENAASATQHAAELVYLDPSEDLALLRINRGSGGAQLPLHVNADRKNSSIPRGSKAALVVVRGGSMVSVEVELVRPALIETKDIYGERDVTRLGYEIKALVSPGDSGSPIVMNGQVVGVLWSRSQQRDNRAWVTDTGALEAHLRNKSPLAVPLNTRCP
jgi:S1-C subfamily serine protease